MKSILITILITLFLLPSYGQELKIEEKKEFPKKSFVLDARFSPFRNFFALTRNNNCLELYNRNWDQIFKHQGNPASYAGVIAFSPDEKYLAYGRYKGKNDIAIIRLKDLKVIQTLRAHSYMVTDLQFSHDCNYLASVSNDHTMVVWKAEGDNFVQFQKFEAYEDDVTNVAFSFDDKYLLTTDDDGFVTIYINNRGEYRLSQKIKNSYSYIYGLDYHPQKNEFLTGSSSGLIKYKLDKNKFIPVDSIKEKLDIRHDFSYSPTGDLVSLSHYREIRFFRTNDPGIREIDGIFRHTDNTLGSRFSSDGQFLASFAVDSALIIWEISPVEPSKRSVISSWVNDNLTPAQRKILTFDVVNDLYNRVDKSMVSPRDEFETTEEYNKRRSALEDWTLSLFQKKVEERYSLKTTGDNTISIPLQAVVGYNADKQIYKILFLETEAGVEIPVKQAKKLKSVWTKARITAARIREEGKMSFTYSDFQLIIPGISGSFNVTPVENPFHISGSVTSSRTTTNEPSVTSAQVSGQPDDQSIITHALLFATNIYDSFSELVNPVLDANTIAAELTENYGVHAEVVTNATLTQTAEKIREYATRAYNESDNLIIFFAGHGVYDEVFKEGYVISTDSRADDISKTSYLSHSNLRTMVNNIRCKHIFLVMDVCFGGTFDPYLATSSHRGAMEMYADIPKEEFIGRKIKYKTRLYLTSGGNEYVPDGRSGFHSPFARRFIEALRKYGGEDGILTTNEILQYVEKVNPQPRFGEFGDNEPGSDFILIAK